jgi:hypothetical protein
MRLLRVGHERHAVPDADDQTPPSVGGDGVGGQRHVPGRA